jgi:2-amino-4-hydroxy-6-hydroxymethyldihydropteridine diphosphokinase
MSESLANIVVVALGSNLGDRVGNLCFAGSRLQARGVPSHKISSVYETPPVGFLDQPPFLNMVVAGTSRLPPRELLSIFHSVEEAAGRGRSFPYAPRPLDLDLLFFGGRIVREEGFTVPHPRWKERSFVTRPLGEILPDLRDPESGWSVQEVQRRWPAEPKEILMVETSEGFRRALKEWKE